MKNTAAIVGTYLRLENKIEQSLTNMEASLRNGRRWSYWFRKMRMQNTKIDHIANQHPGIERSLN